LPDRSGVRILTAARPIKTGWIVMVDGVTCAVALS
jgi:hypothetical protein